MCLLFEVELISLKQTCFSARMPFASLEENLSAKILSILKIYEGAREKLAWALCKVTFSRFPTGRFLSNPTVTNPDYIYKTGKSSCLMLVTDTSTTIQHVTLFHKDVEDTAWGK